MNVTELIAAVGGDENIGFQPLDSHATALDWSAKTGARITFRSDVMITPEGTEKLGLVVWFDRAAVKAALAKARGEQ
jgi:UDP-N-acetylglucosamine enolpyruvyl transferase